MTRAVPRTARPRIGSTWEGDLGTDRWLRGAWRVGSERSGRWRARHIGRQAVNQTLKPMVDAGAEWLGAEVREERKPS